MLNYIGRRILYMLLLLVMASVVSFAIIVLPPGDYLTSYINQLRAQGNEIAQEHLARKGQWDTAFILTHLGPQNSEKPCGVASGGTILPAR